MTTVRRKGRPMKAPAKGKRAALSLLVRPDIKRHVDRLATANGRTQSAEGEALIERALAIEGVLSAMRLTLEDVAKGNAEAAFRRLGYTMVRNPDTGHKAWFEPGYPGAPAGNGFIAPEEDQ